MERSTMPVNEMLRDEISRIDHTLIPPGFRGDVREVRAMQDSLSKIIDEIGEQSACAQGLNKVITTAEKLRNQPSHTLYLMKDSMANERRGEVIGFVRVGHKRLYLFDPNGQTHELEPLCVLDLFVRADRQRRGFGKKLFDHMLQDQCVQVTRLAVDGPSDKMVSFLQRNYNVRDLRRQPNNFAVAPEFFAPMRVASGRSTPSLSTPVGRYSAPRPHSDIAMEPETTYGRFAARQPHTTMAAVIHGSNGGGRHGVAAADHSNGTSAVATLPDESERDVEVPTAAADADPSEAEDATQPPPERPNSLHIETEAPPSDVASPRPPASPVAGAVTPRRDSQVTEQGFFDIKFYHNKLW